MRGFARRCVALWGLVLIGCVSSASASVVIGGTRVVYPDGQRDVSVQLMNRGESPALVQVWIDEGDARVSPEASQAPFVILPPLARIEPDSGQVVRIAFTGGADLPENRESVFWLNVLDVPPLPEGDGQVPQNYMQLAVRSRIKLFFRPKGLKGLANRAPEALVWSLVRSRQGQGRGRTMLRVENPTPYHVSLARLRIPSGEAYRSIPLDDQSMLAPMSSTLFPLPEEPPETASRIEITTINDFGGRVTQTVPVVR